MALATIPTFTPSGFTSMSAQAESSAIALPAGVSPVTVLIVNLGPTPAAVLVGADDTIVASQSNGTVVMPGQSLALAYGAWLAAVSLGYGSAFLNISVGV
jgi:hypothetical protein